MPSTEIIRLHPDAIRQRAQLVPGCREIAFSDQLKVLSFIVTVDNNTIASGASSSSTTASNTNNNSGSNATNTNNSVEKKNTSPQDQSNAISTSPQLARVNIYYQTGTIGVCHVIHHEVREYFHEKASLDTVERILRNPENTRAITFSLMNLEKSSSFSSTQATSTNKNTSSSNSGEDPSSSSNTASVSQWKQKLELVDVGIAVLVAERDKLMEHSKLLEKKGLKEDHLQPQLRNHIPKLQQQTSEEEEEEEEAETDEVGDEDDEDEDDLSLVQQGKNFAYSLPDDTVAKVDEYLDCWEDVKCVATNGQGTVVLYESGEWKFTQGIPRFLRNKLLNRQSTLPAPVYVSIGCENQYFISFSDGNFEWMGCDTMRDILMKSTRDVRAITFGSNYDSFFIVYDDGSWQYNGDIPNGLENKLKGRGERGDLTCVSLGPNGEWFLAVSNGRRWWGGVSEELGNAIAPIKDRISFMDFGVDGSFMVRYV